MPFAHRSRALPAALSLALLATAACSWLIPPADPLRRFTGHYEGAPTSEGVLQLVLWPNGTAVIRPAGLPENVDVTEPVEDADLPVLALWQPEGGEVVISYGGVIDRLRFVGDLSMEGLGSVGSKPGLEPMPPIAPESLLKENVWLVQRVFRSTRHP